MKRGRAEKSKRECLAGYLAEYEIQDISIQGMEIEEIVRRLYQGRAAV